MTVGASIGPREEISNTTLPKGVGSWAGEGDAMKAIGARSPTNSRAIFPPARYRIRTQGDAVHRRPAGPARKPAARARRPSAVITASRSGAKPGVYDVQLAGDGAEGDSSRRRVEAAQRQVRAAVLFAGTHRGRGGQRFSRRRAPSRQFSPGSRPIRPQGVRRAARPAKADQGSRNAAPPRHLRWTASRSLRSLPPGRTVRFGRLRAH